MGKYLMVNFNKELRPLLPVELKNDISKALRKKPKPKGMEDIDRMLDLRPSISKMTGGQVIMELQLNGEEELASSLLNFVMEIEHEARDCNGE